MSQPSVTVTFEPLDNGVVSFLRCAPAGAGASERGLLNLTLRITNTSSFAIRIIGVEVSVTNSPTPPKAWMMTLPKASEDPLAPSGHVTWVQEGDYVFEIPTTFFSAKVRIWAHEPGTAGAAEVIPFQTSLMPHMSPTPQKSYRFWGAVRDLRPDEYWDVNGTSHGQTSSQLFGYDVGIGVENGNSSQYCLPNMDGSENHHYRIWGKPVYAVADGTVVHFRNDFPVNPRPLRQDEEYEDAFPDLHAQWSALGDGNGNFFTIATGDETVLYAHLQAGSLNPDFLAPGSTVKAGAFLGLCGNSGSSSAPHLHVHANKTIANDTKSWNNAGRPMPMRRAQAVPWLSLGAVGPSAPWVALNGRGVPAAACAVWPSDTPVVTLRYASIKHVAISDEGRLWVVRTDNTVRTSDDRLPGSGVFLGVDPGGSAREVAVVREQPFLIGMDNLLWEGLSDRWSPVAGSPAFRRVASDEVTHRLWLIALNGDIIVFDPAARTWTEHAGGGKGKDICVSRGVPYVIGTDDKVWKSAAANGWTPLPGNGKGKRIAVDRQTSTLWVVDMNDRLKSHSGGGNWHEHPGGGVGKEILIHEGTPYVVGSDDGLWKSVGASGWMRMNLVEPA